MEPPQELKRGPKVVREALNELRRWAISQRPLPSLDCDIHETPIGRVILPRPAQSKPKASAPSASSHPWKPTFIEGKFTVSPGVIADAYGNTLLPSNDGAEFNLASGTTWCWLKISVASSGEAYGQQIDITNAEVQAGGTVGGGQIPTTVSGNGTVPSFLLISLFFVEAEVPEGGSHPAPTRVVQLARNSFILTETIGNVSLNSGELTLTRTVDLATL